MEHKKAKKAKKMAEEAMRMMALEEQIAQMQPDLQPEDGYINPGAEEVCDEIDNNCDEIIDDDAADADLWYADDDGDGFGNLSDTMDACSQPFGYVMDSADCDDNNNTIHPDATEVCDGLDNNCDGETDDESAADAFTFYLDGDGDGFGDDNTAFLACSQLEGSSAVAGDCADDAPSVNPNAEESCDGIDNNCDGETDEDSAIDVSRS